MIVSARTKGGVAPRWFAVHELLPCSYLFNRVELLFPLGMRGGCAATTSGSWGVGTGTAVVGSTPSYLFAGQQQQQQQQQESNLINSTVPASATETTITLTDKNKRSNSDSMATDFRDINKKKINNDGRLTELIGFASNPFHCGSQPTSSIIGYKSYSVRTSLQDELWSVIDDIITLNDCDVYSYLSDKASEGTSLSSAYGSRNRLLFDSL